MFFRSIKRFSNKTNVFGIINLRHYYKPMEVNVKPHDYARTADALAGIFETFIKDYAINFKPCKNILDIGCGSGELSRKIVSWPDQVQELVGIDVAKTYIEHCKTKSTDKRLKYFVMDAMAKWPSEWKFDLIYSNYAMQRIPDHPPVYANLNNHLKSNGQALIVMCTSTRFTNEIMEIMFQKKRWEEYKPTETLYSGEHLPKDYAKMITNSGLVVKEYEIRKFDIIFEDKEEFISHLVWWVPGLDFVPRKLQKEFMNQYVEHLSDEQGYKATYLSLFVHALKL